jgi:hypothetical protein
MANTFYLDTKSGRGTYQDRYLKLECTQKTDVTNNKSTINWTLSAIGGESNYYSTGPTTVKINGVQVYYRSRAEWDSYIFPAAKGSVSGSIVVDHTADGSKKINISIATAVWYGQTQEFDGTWELDSIPRKASITSASDFTDVGNPSIFFSNPGNFKTDVWLEPNLDGDHLCVRENIPNTGSYTWTLTNEEREALRKKCKGNSCKIRFVLYSYVESATYSDYRDMTYTMTENEATKPSVDINISLNNGTLPSEFNGLFIQGKSKVNVSVTGKAKYNSSIESVWVEIEGKEYDAWPTIITSGVLQGSGEVKIIGYAKDSREFTRSATLSVNVIPYSKPLLAPLGSENAILCYRSDGNGKRVSNSTSVWIKVKMTYYTVDGKNACSLQWRRKLTTEEWDDTKHEWNRIYGAEDEYSALLTGVVFDVKKAYTVQIRAIDDIGEFDIKNFEIPTQDVALHLGKGGKNVSIGTYCDYSEEYTFYSDWKAIFGNGVYIGDSKTSLKDYILKIVNEGE